MSDNWVAQNLENALETWNEKLAEIWQLITTTPQDFKGGGIWGVIVNINGAVPVSYTHLFDKSLCKEPVEAGSGKISILLVEPNKYPKMIEIDDTLEAMQTVVGLSLIHI